MLDNNGIWHITGLVSYSDDTSVNAFATTDFGTVRTSEDSALATLRIAYTNNQAFKDLITELLAQGLSTTGMINGLPHTIGNDTGTADSTVNSVAWRVMVLNTGGSQIYVAGSNEDMGASLESNDIAAAVAQLNEDAGFLSTLASISS